MSELDNIVRNARTSHSVVTAEWFRRHRGKALLQMYGSVSNLLKSFFPTAEVTNVQHKQRKSQRYLTDLIMSILDQPVLENYKHPDLKFQSTGRILITQVLQDY
jgi:hypothetical protein